MPRFLIGTVVLLAVSTLTYTEVAAGLYLFLYVIVFGIPLAWLLVAIPTIALLCLAGVTLAIILRGLVGNGIAAGFLATAMVLSVYAYLPRLMNADADTRADAILASDTDAVAPAPAETVGLATGDEVCSATCIDLLVSRRVKTVVNLDAASVTDPTATGTAYALVKRPGCDPAAALGRGYGISGVLTVLGQEGECIAENAAPQTLDLVLVREVDTPRSDAEAAALTLDRPFKIRRYLILRRSGEALVPVVQSTELTVPRYSEPMLISQAPTHPGQRIVPGLSITERVRYGLEGPMAYDDRRSQRTMLEAALGAELKPPEEEPQDPREVLERQRFLVAELAQRHAPFTAADKQLLDAYLLAVRVRPTEEDREILAALIANPELPFDPWMSSALQEFLPNDAAGAARVSEDLMKRLRGALAIHDADELNAISSEIDDLPRETVAAYAEELIAVLETSEDLPNLTYLIEPVLFSGAADSALAVRLLDRTSEFDETPSYSTGFGAQTLSRATVSAICMLGPAVAEHSEDILRIMHRLKSEGRFRMRVNETAYALIRLGMPTEKAILEVYGEDLGRYQNEASWIRRKAGSLISDPDLRTLRIYCYN